MFETGVPGEAAEPFAAQLPQTQPSLTPAAHARIESALRELRADLLEGIVRHETALAQLESDGTSADAERMTRARQNLAVLDGELNQTTAALRRLADGT